MALEITDATFEDVVLNSDKPVVVDFWAARRVTEVYVDQWCIDPTGGMSSVAAARP